MLNPILILTIFTAVVITVALMAYIPIARRNGWVPMRYKRTSADTSADIPVVGGGFIFYVSMMIWSLGISLIYGTNFSMTTSLVGMTMLAACSFADDLLDMRVSTRLIVQMIAVMFLCLQFIQSDVLPLKLYWLLPIYIVFALYFINCYNFMDGIDGITPAYTIVVLSSLLWINETGTWFMSGTFIGYALLGAVVFAMFNFRCRAKVYAGDVGSITMGYIIVTILTYYILYTHSLSALVLVCVYLVDTILSIIRRIVRRENIFRPHHLHAYQLLARVHGWPHLAIAGIYATLQAAISVGYILLPPDTRWPYTIAVIILLIIAYAIVVFKSRRRNPESTPAVNSDKHN